MTIKIPEQATNISSPTGPVLVRPYQIVLPVRLIVAGITSPCFPSILDTGHSHNFSIRAEQLHDWCGVSPRVVGHIKVNGQLVPLIAAEIDLDGSLLSCSEGIAVYPDRHPAAPRLPLLGLRSLVRNAVRVTIANGEVTIGR